MLDPMKRRPFINAVPPISLPKPPTVEELMARMDNKPRPYPSLAPEDAEALEREIEAFELDEELFDRTGEIRPKPSSR